MELEENNGQDCPHHHLRAIRKELGDENVTCGKCGELASTCEPSAADGYGLGECLVFYCDGCPARAWAYCRTCKKRFFHSNTRSHPFSKKHKSAIEPPEEEKVEVPMVEDATEADVSPNGLMETFEAEIAATYNEDDDDEMETIMEDSPIKEPASTNGSLQYPIFNIKGNEWMALEFKETPRATLQEMATAFANEEEMGNYWFAEHATPVGYCGGGLRYVVARTFQSAEKGYHIDNKRVPEYPEARWQFENFLQYQSMNDKQRQRQSRITKAIMDHVQQQTGNFFQHTFIPAYKDLSRIYGRTGKQSMWNTLPIPTPQNVHGVSYVSPISILKFCFANGVPVDDIVVQSGAPLLSDEGNSSDDESTIGDETMVCHVSQCRKVTEWTGHLASNREKAYAKLVALGLSDWKDGFGPSRVKNNRGSVDAWTFTISPPKHLVNATDNTFLMGLGPKKATKGWDAVAHMFRKDMEHLTLNGPHMFYRGDLQKIVPTECKRLASLTDKVERPDSTSTIASGSDMHRCFGTVGKIETPKCHVDKVKEFIEAEQLGQTTGEWGWCDAFIDAQGRNGAKFPTCKSCRKKRLQHLGAIPSRSNQQQSQKCKSCGDWTQWRADDENKKLCFNASKDYPTFSAPGCPVEPPAGREPGLTELCPLKLTWNLMISACRFAFYNSSRPTSRSRWNKKTCLEYGRACGIGKKIMELVYKAAEAARSEDGEVSYSDKESIGAFQIPAAWIGDISLSDYIETIMHLMHLGISESNLDLATQWLKKTKTTGVNSAKFRSSVQELLVELKKFQLGWLLVYFFTGNDLKTGAWVSENWLAFARISPIIFGWLCPSPDDDDAVGDYLDLARLILSYHCVAARVHTHGGIDEAFINETEHYMKEFLSCVRELDVRVRHKKLNATVEKVSERKKTEAFWLKTNYMSLLNLLNMMVELGPLVLWWDGGGKGERFIQEIKPHILRGIRADITGFFVNLHSKIYKVRQLKYMEERLGLQSDPVDHGEDEVGLVSLTEAVAELEDEESDLESDCSESEDDSVGEKDVQFSKVEDEGMHKKSTIYIYRNLALLEEAIEKVKPIAGFLQVEQRPSKTGGGDGKKTFVFYTVHRHPVKQFARRELEFLDQKGIQHHGMWYADVKAHVENVQITDSFVDIQEAAKMSAVAIPLRYIIKEERDDLKDKYCVITNYWKVRNPNGCYSLPRLDPSLYKNKKRHQGQPTGFL